ncbi:MAG: hypothetical protein KKE09_05300, partial [Bacteroidetes bacterium]|nr:hypothetical protein [Bacteroidota bacterium]
YTKDDFYEFGIKIGITETRVQKLLSLIIFESNEIENLINSSFLNNELKTIYSKTIDDRIKRLKYSYSKDNG